jgi:hypothetical protein
MPQVSTRAARNRPNAGDLLQNWNRAVTLERAVPP